MSELKPVHVLVEEETVDRSDALAGRYKGITRSHVIRIALKRGLDDIEKNPLLLMEEEE